jgi:hypothetical protein
LRAGLVLPLGHRLLRRIPGVRGQRRPATHAREAAVLGVGDLRHLVLRRPEPDLVLGDEGDALTQAGRRRARDHVDPATARQADELLAGLRDDVTSGPYSIIGRRAPKMLSVCSSLTAVIWTSGVGHGMPIGSPGSYSYSQPQPQPWSRQSYTSPPSGPAGEQRRADALEADMRRRVRALADLLRADQQPAAVLERRPEDRVTGFHRVARTR